MEYEIFTRKWLERSERQNENVDKGDNFIALWISFNSWMKLKFGEKDSDSVLISKVGQLDEFKSTFIELKSEVSFNQNLMKLAEYAVIDMREPNNGDKNKEYDGSFESLINTIYQIRCNLFHGRKNINDDRNDFELVCLAYDILLPLFKKYLQKNHLI